MAEETTMSPISAAEPPKVNPLSKPTATATLKPVSKPAAGAATAALRPGLKLPPKPGATVSALRPGLKLPTKPVIHKPGEAGKAPALPKPIVGAPAAAAAKPSVPPPVAAPAPAAAAPAAAPAPAPAPAAAPDSMAALKTVTQKLKGVTQQIPQQAILKKTGIIADDAMSAAQKEAAKHKTARISLSDAMGVAPVKNENAPMKTIQIKRPVGIAGGTKPLTPQPAPAAAAAEPAAATPTDTQRKTLKLTRPAGGVRPTGKFGVKRPAAPTAAPASAEGAAPAEGAVADIADIPTIADLPTPVQVPAAAASDGPAWLAALSVIVQLAACVLVGALAWFLFEATQAAPF